MKLLTLDIETTGLNHNGNKIIEIGCIEIKDRKITNNMFHTYINPEIVINEEITKITGIKNEFLKNKPKFKEIVDDFLKFIFEYKDIIIHNADFDVNFINTELSRINHNIKNIKEYFNIIDTLKIARKKHPGKKNNLNALCNRYSIKTEIREYHGALIDAKLLAEVFIKMTSSQTKIKITSKEITKKEEINEKIDIKVIKANKLEIIKHNKYMEQLKIISDKK